MSVNLGPKIPVFVKGDSGDTYLTQGNAFLRSIQPLLECNVISMALTAPPATPANGDTYIPASVATGDWATHENQIAYWSTDNPNFPAGEWEFFTPAKGWILGNQADGLAYFFGGATWAAITSGFSKVALLDGASASPSLADNHIACGTVSLAAGVGANSIVTLTGTSIFSAAAKYEVVVVPILTGVANIFVTKSDGSHFTVTADVTTNPTVFLWIAVGRA